MSNEEEAYLLIAIDEFEDSDEEPDGIIWAHSKNFVYRLKWEMGRWSQPETNGFLVPSNPTDDFDSYLRIDIQ